MSSCCEDASSNRVNAYLSPGTGEGLDRSQGLSRVTDVEEEGAGPQCLLMIQVEEEGVEPQCLLMSQVEEEEGVELRRHLHHSELRFHLLGGELELWWWWRW